MGTYTDDAAISASDKDPTSMRMTSNYPERPYTLADEM